MPTYAVSHACVERAHSLIRARQYVLESDWGAAQPDAGAENRFLASHTWEEFASWHLGLRAGAAEVELAAHDLLQELDGVSDTVSQ